MCSEGPLRLVTVVIGVAFSLASVAGVGATLFLLFGEPLGDYTKGTYTPSAEDVGQFPKQKCLTKFERHSNNVRGRQLYEMETVRACVVSCEL